MFVVCRLGVILSYTPNGCQGRPLKEVQISQIFNLLAPATTEHRFLADRIRSEKEFNGSKYRLCPVRDISKR